MTIRRLFRWLFGRKKRTAHEVKNLWVDAARMQ